MAAAHVGGPADPRRFAGVGLVIVGRRSLRRLLTRADEGQVT